MMSQETHSRHVYEGFSPQKIRGDIYTSNLSRISINNHNISLVKETLEAPKTLGKSVSINYIP